MRRNHSLAAICAMWITSATMAGGTAVDSGFTYQGRLTDSGSTISEDVDMKFRLYDAETDGGLVGVELEVLTMTVDEGLFSIDLDFGNVFAGQRRWLEIDVRLTADAGAFTTLSPRNAWTPTSTILFTHQARNTCSFLEQSTWEASKGHLLRRVAIRGGASARRRLISQFIVSG